MKIIKKLVLFVIFSAIISCGGTGGSSYVHTPYDGNAREKMREFVIKLSEYAETKKPGFIIIPQNGQAVIDEYDETTYVGEYGKDEYFNAIDGTGREDLYYGYDTDNVATSEADTAEMVELCNRFKIAVKTVLVTDYCWDRSKVDDSYTKNNNKGYISFAAPARELNEVPEGHPKGVNSNNITSLSDAKNFLYIIGANDSATITKIKETNYDLIIMDAYKEDGTIFTSSEIEELKTKKNGGSRLVIAYMSIGEAENYRYYWNNSWKPGSPEYICEENPSWAGNYKVKYWMDKWQNIIYGDEKSYLKKIIDAGFDGVYLDIIDAYEYFEE